MYIQIVKRLTYTKDGLPLTFGQQHGDIQKGPKIKDAKLGCFATGMNVGNKLISNLFFKQFQFIAAQNLGRSGIKSGGKGGGKNS